MALQPIYYPCIKIITIIITQAKSFFTSLALKYVSMTCERPFELWVPFF